uniref:Polycomb protein VEFS-Box domain-containing protein n=1 Tax=Panagrolaimus davidi TaxID=227884 RepID=A0A914PK99_9BILA
MKRKRNKQEPGPSYKMPKRKSNKQESGPSYKVPCTFSIVAAPVPGLYGHEISMTFINQTFHIRLNELIDVETQEKEFYFLWNTFISERSNRRIGILAMYNTLLSFIHQKYDEIKKRNLKSVWNIFVLYFKNLKILTEEQFFTLVFYRGNFDGKWFGYKTQ